jgi:hypothetical protein
MPKEKIIICECGRKVKRSYSEIINKKGFYEEYHCVCGWDYSFMSEIN